MAAPLFQQILQPTKFDEYLDELGLGNMSPQARVKMADDLMQIVQYRIVTEAYSSLSAQEKLDYMELMQEAVKNDNYTKSNQFLYQHIPEIETFAEEIIDEELEKLRPGAAVFRKVTDEFLEHLKKGQKFEEEGAPNLPLDTSLIPPTADDEPIAPEEAAKIASRPLEAPLRQEALETPEAPEVAPLPQPSDTVADETPDLSAPFPWELPPDTSSSVSDTTGAADSMSGNTSMSDTSPDLADSPADTAQNSSNNGASSQAMADELDALKN
jgi:hypothetical protein